MDVIFCDSACDLEENILKEYSIKRIDFPYSLDGEEQKPLIYEEDYKNYYNKVRRGAISSTSLINEFTFREIFEEELKKGNDILYIHLSSKLTSTFNTMNSLVEDLKKQYPERKVFIIDSLGVSMQIGILVYLAAQRLKKGEKLEDIYNYIQEKRKKIACYFICRDLSYLKRGGRISAIQAMCGTLLGVRPLLKCDAEGKIVKVEMIRGKLAMVKRLLSLLKEEGENVLDYPIAIMNSDCNEDAQALKTEIENYLGKDDNIFVNNLGTIIGTHCGPDTLGLIFNANKR